jgi:hypothetical protein
MFVNSYASLYYIAFFKNGFRFFESDDPALKDACKDTLGNDGYIIRSFNIISGNHFTHLDLNTDSSGGCVDELTLQLITILITNFSIGQAREVAIPYEYIIFI